MHKYNTQVRRQAAQAVLVVVVLFSLILWLLWPSSSGKSLDAPTRQPSATPESVKAQQLKREDVLTNTGRKGEDEPESTEVIHVGGMPEVDPDEPRAESTHISVSFVMSNTMSIAWKASSKRLSFPTKLSVNGLGAHHPTRKYPSGIPATATYYGKSSLKLKYTKRRSLHIQLDAPIAFEAEGPAISNFLLLSLWEDKYRQAYRSSIELLRELGLFHSYAKLVELRCTSSFPSSSAGGDSNVCDGGQSLGTYLLLEYPSDSIARHVRSELEGEGPVQRPCEADEEFSARRQVFQSISGGAQAPVEIGTRNWFYFENPKKYDILHVPSYSRNSSLSSQYANLEKDVAKQSVLAPGATQMFDTNLYLTWIAVNSLLMNGDYDDEVFFYRVGKFMSIMAWDYDTVFAPCHRKEAVPSRLFYCAETPIEKSILTNPDLQKQYRRTLQCVLQKVATTEKWEHVVNGVVLPELKAVMSSSLASEKATFDDVKAPRDVGQGAKELVSMFQQRREALLAALPSETSKHIHSASSASSQGIVAKDNDGKKCARSSVLKVVAPLVRKSVPREHKGKGAVDIPSMINSIKSSSLQLKAISIMSPSGTVLTDVTSALPVTEPGLYCAKIQVDCTASTAPATASQIVDFDYPFVVRSRERGTAEFAVAHFDKPNPLALIAPLVALNTGSVSLVVSVPRRWIHANWFPVVAQVVHRSEDGAATQSWVRKNIAVSLTEGGSKESLMSTMLVRGFSAIAVLTESKSSEADLKYAKEGPALMGTKKKFSLYLPQLPDSAAGQVSTPDIVDVSAEEAPPSLVGIERMFGDNCVLVIDGKLSVAAGKKLVVEQGCLVVMKEGSTLIVNGALELRGTLSKPVTVSSLSSEGQPWETILVQGKPATLVMTHVFVTGSGAAGKLVAHTGKHHKHSAAVTVVGGGSVTVERSAFLRLQGPAFAAGTHGRVTITESVVQWAELGIECVQCDFFCSLSTWTIFPSWDSSYVDEDNDAMYLSGGDHRVKNSVIAHAKDDCVDSGTPEKFTGAGGSLFIEGTIIEMCQHEAVALSSSPRSERTVKLERLLISHSQQGIESGYTGSKHNAEVSRVLIQHTNVALRFGDNYYNRPQQGHLKASQVVLWGNAVNSMNYVREIAGPQFTSLFRIDGGNESNFVFSPTSAVSRSGMCQQLFLTTASLSTQAVAEGEDALMNLVAAGDQKASCPACTVLANIKNV